MKIYFCLIVLFSNFVFSQNNYDRIIDEKIKLLENKYPINQLEEKKMIQQCNELYYLSKESGNEDGMLKALLTLAMIYSDKMDTNECLKVTTEGIILANELKKKKEYVQLLSFKGKALMQAGNLSDSRSLFSKALQVVNSIVNKDEMYVQKTFIYNSLVDYSEIYEQKHKNSGYKDSILFFSQKGYDESLKISDKYSRKNIVVGQSARILGTMYYLIFNNIKQGEKYFGIAEKLFINDSDKRFIVALYDGRGQVEFRQERYEKALEYYKKALELSKDTNYTAYAIIIYDHLVEYYKKTGDTKNELYYLHKGKTLNDSLSSINQDALISQGRSDINLVNQQRRKNTWIISSISIGASLFFIVLLYLYRKKKLEEKNLEEFKIKSADSQLNVIDQNKISVLLEMIKRNDKEFLITFQEEFSGFYKKLLELPELTPADVELCIYLKLNIQTKEIAMYKRVSIGAVDNRKYRIRKKLNLPPEANLYKWINTI